MKYSNTFYYKVHDDGVDNMSETPLFCSDKQLAIAIYIVILTVCASFFIWGLYIAPVLQEYQQGYTFFSFSFGIYIQYCLQTNDVIAHRPVSMKIPHRIQDCTS